MPPAPLRTGTASPQLELSTTVPTAGPDIDLRQVVQSNYYVTLTISRGYTTYTTTILLAGTEPAATPSPSTAAIVNAAASTTTAIAGPATTTTTAIASPGTMTTTAIAPPPNTTTVLAAQTTAPAAVAGSTDPSSGSIVGAIVGAILGSLVFILLLWVCFYRPTLFRLEGSTVSGSTWSSSSGSTDRRSSRRTRRVRVKETRRVRVRELDDD